MPDTTVVVRKISKKHFVEEKLQICKEEKQPPKDTFNFVGIMFFCLGLMHWLPLSFFVTANGYWMYKFRNVSIINSSDTDSRTVLQSYFASGTMVAQTIPHIIMMFATTLLGYKIKCITRILVSISLLVVSFIIATLFIKINTDSWQTAFFIINLFIMAVISGANEVLEVTNFALLTRFPKKYTKWYLMGEGIAGTLSACLQLISLAVATTEIVSALIYFITGTAIMSLSLVLFVSAQRTKFFRYQMEHSTEDTKRKMATFSEMMEMLKLIWPCVIMYILLQLSALPTHPAITSLVVSENYGSGSPWAVKYFTPVVTFLISALSALSGRTLATKLNMTWSGLTITLVMLFRVLFFVPTIMLCNAMPRKHLPVIFKHDWQYILLMISLNFSAGYIFNAIFLTVTRLVSKEKRELAFMVLMLVTGLCGVMMSPLSLLSVKLI